MQRLFRFAIFGGFLLTATGCGGDSGDKVIPPKDFKQAPAVKTAGTGKSAPKIPSKDVD